MAKDKTALSKAPKTKAKPSEELRRVSPGVYRNAAGELVNSKGNRINRSGQRVDKPKEAPKTPSKQKKPTKPEKPKKEEPRKPPSANTPITKLDPEDRVGRINTEVSKSMEDYLNELQAQGAFNPGDYQQDYQDAYRNVYDQFEAQNAQQFALEAEGVEEMIAQRGIDPAGRQAERLRAQMAQNQGNLRRQAQLAAEQAGRAVEQQRFERELTTYNVPTQQIAALSGLFSGQVGSVEAARQREFGSTDQEKQRVFEAEQEKLRREQAMKIAEMNKRGGGGGPDPFAVMEAEYRLKRDLLYDQATILGQQNNGQNPLNSAASGFGQGFGAGLGANLGRRG
jgi:hypothetical protein